METVAAAKKQGSAAELLGGACGWEAALLHWVDQVGGASRRLPHARTGTGTGTGAGSVGNQVGSRFCSLVWNLPS